MTEITGSIAKHERHMIDPVMFAIAMVLAPLLVTALSFWLLLVPVVALVMGGPLYLLVGTPVLLWWLGRNAPQPGEIAWLGFCANLLICAGIYLYAMASNQYDAEGMAILYLIFGSIFAPIWAWAFGKLYLSLRRPFFAQTV